MCEDGAEAQSVFIGLYFGLGVFEGQSNQGPEGIVNDAEVPRMLPLAAIAV